MNKIRIKPKNKGKFNATKKATGKTTEELTHSKNPVTKKRAVFAQNAKKWNHKKAANGLLVPTNDSPDMLQQYDANVANMDITGEYNPSGSPIDSKYYTPTDPLSTGYNLPTETYNPMLTGQINEYKATKPMKPVMPTFQFSGNKYFQRAGQHLTNAVNFGAQIPKAQNGYITAMGMTQLPNSAQNNQLQLPQNNTPYQSLQSQDNTPYQGYNTINSNYNSNGLQATGAALGTVAETALTGINLGKGILDEMGNSRLNKNQQLRDAQMMQQSLYSQAADVRPYNTLGVSQGGSNSVLSLGGKVKFADGGEIDDYNTNRNGQYPSVEVEKGEFVADNQGLAGNVDSGEKHNFGGTPMNLPPNSIVFSEKLKDKNTGKSFSKLAKPFSTEKNIEMLDSKFADPIQKATANLNIKFKNNKLQDLFANQESQKILGEFGSKIAIETSNNKFSFGGVVEDGYQVIHRADLGGYYRKKI